MLEYVIVKVALNVDTKLHTCSIYDLYILTKEETQMVLRMQVKSNTPQDVYTGFYPDTAHVLQKCAPSVLGTKCFNENHLPFSKEVKNTELGHLFEHILIQKLSDLKDSIGEHAVYSGYTSWNWNELPYGTYDIWMDIPSSDSVYFQQALSETIRIFDEILVSAKKLRK